MIKPFDTPGSGKRSILRYAWLLILPLYLLVFQFYAMRNSGHFFMDRADPDYMYLFNACNLASGKLVIGHIDHPGTTTQFTAAAIVKCTYLFTGKEKTLAADVMADPEKYLRTISYGLMLLCLVALFFLGRTVLRISNNIALAVFFQLSSVAFFTMVLCLPEARAEPFLELGGYLLAAVLFAFVSEKEMDRKRTRRYTILFAFICAFLTVSKISAAPLAVLPLFLLPRWKELFVYIAALIFFSLLMVLPILKQLGTFYHWVVALCTHKGLYGLGAQGVVDASEFRQNLLSVFSDDKIFGSLCVLIFVAIIYLLLKKQYTAAKWKSNVLLRCFTGIGVVLLLNIVIVAKHYRSHYLIPVMGLFPLAVYAAVRLFLQVQGITAGRIFTRKNQALIVAALSLFLTWEIAHQYFFYRDLRNPKLNTAEVLDHYKAVPRLYMTENAYTAEAAPALNFGADYAGRLRYEYYKLLRQFYPGANFISYPDLKVKCWGDEMEFHEFLEENKSAVLYFPDMDSTVVNGMIATMLNSPEAEGKISIDRLFFNAETGERTYMLHVNGEITRQPLTDSANSVTCDAEQVKGDSLLFSDHVKAFFDPAGRVSSEHHSGNWSIRSDEKNAFVFHHAVVLDQSKQTEVTVWRKSESHHGCIVAANADGTYYRQLSTIAERGENGWVMLRARLDLPPGMDHCEIMVYAWNEYEPTPVYFDDFSIIQR